MGQRLGQHFLKDKRVLHTIVSALEPHGGDIVVEIGAGHGELTDAILSSIDTTTKVIATEKDGGLARTLMEKFSDDSRVKVIEGDILQVLPSIARNAEPDTYKLTGNIPYYITGRLLRRVGELRDKPALSVLTLQREVAERLVAAPPKMNRLAAAVQFWATPELVTTVSRLAFRPRPKVDSAVVTLALRKERYDIEPEKYYRAVRALFAHPRKTVLNNLAEAQTHTEKEELKKALRACGIASGVRPQNLSVEDIVCLSAFLH